MINKDAGSVYADTTALAGWNKKLNTINTEAIEILENIEKELLKVDDAWIGNASKGFKTSSEELLAISKKYHTGMKETNTFLVTVANHMQER